MRHPIKIIRNILLAAIAAIVVLAGVLAFNVVTHGSRQIEVGDETNVDVGEAGEVLEILRRDDSRADQADSRAAAHSAPGTSFDRSQASDCAMPSNTSPE